MKMQDIKKHNGVIGFWKFMFSIMILIYHLKLVTKSNESILKCGYIGVEFFLLVSGYLLAKSVFNKKDEYTQLGCETFENI